MKNIGFVKTVMVKEEVMCKHAKIVRAKE